MRKKQINPASIMKAKTAFTLIEIMVVVAIIGLLLGIAVPNYLKSRRDAGINACQAQQRLVIDAIYAYLNDNPAIDENSAPPQDGTGTWYEFLRTGAAPQCPSNDSDYTIGGTYRIPTVTCTSGFEGH